jgi:centromeric protein E
MMSSRGGGDTASNSRGPTPTTTPRKRKLKDRGDEPDDNSGPGRITVAVRIRPLKLGGTTHEGGGRGEDEKAMFYAQGGTHVCQARPSWLPADAHGNVWKVDAVFDQGDGNEEVYKRSARPVVAAVLSGVNGTVMAYGQTSSGKTHTMSGTQRDPGIMERAVDDIFREAAMQQGTRRFRVVCSYLELYDNHVRDLLATAGEEKDRPAITVCTDLTGTTQVKNLKEQVVRTPVDVMKLVGVGTPSRHTSQTIHNATSSRSHAVLILKVNSKPEDGRGGLALSSTLYVVDLAGSESANPNSSSTAADKQTKREGASINLSLCALGKCVSALATNKLHVPFRDSKLTFILQPALGGPGRTAIIAAVTPAEGQVQETTNTLNFVSEAKSVKMEARVNATLPAAPVPEERRALADMRADAAAEAVRREADTEAHGQTLQALRRVERQLSVAEQRADELGTVAEAAERRDALSGERLRAAEARAAAAEGERDVAIAAARAAADALADSSSGNEADVDALSRALDVARQDAQGAAVVAAAAKFAADEAEAATVRLRNETAAAHATAATSDAAAAAAVGSSAGAAEAVAVARAEAEAAKAEAVAARAEAEAAREAEDAALGAAARELEKADVDKAAAIAAVESRLATEVSRVEAAAEAAAAAAFALHTTLTSAAHAEGAALHDALTRATHAEAAAAKEARRGEDAARAAAAAATAATASRAEEVSADRERIAAVESKASAALLAEERRRTLVVAELANIQSNLEDAQSKLADAQPKLAELANVQSNLEDAQSKLADAQPKLAELAGTREELAEARVELAAAACAVERASAAVETEKSRRQKLEVSVAAAQAKADRLEVGATL